MNDQVSEGSEKEIERIQAEVLIVDVEVEQPVLQKMVSSVNKNKRDSLGHQQQNMFKRTTTNAGTGNRFSIIPLVEVDQLIIPEVS